MPRLRGPSRGICTGSSDVRSAPGATGALTALACAAGLVAGLAATGCATLTPPVDFDGTAPRETSTTARSDGLSIAPVAGRPSGLVLELGADSPPAPEGKLLIRRGRGDSATTLRSVSVDARVVERLAGRGIQFVDRSPPTSDSVTYRLVYRRDDGSPDRRVELELPWGKTPRKPQALEATAPSNRAVEVRWSPTSLPAVVYRRNVTAGREQGRPVAVLHEGHGGTFVDREVRPGDVYAYRVAVARRHPGFLQRGPRSRAFYVSVPGSENESKN